MKNILVKNQRNTVVCTKDKENVGSSKPAGETNAVSGATQISAQKLLHSQLLLQNFQRRRLGKIHRKQKVPEAEVHVGEYLACRARIILRVLVRISSSQERDANCRKSALLHNVEMRNNPAKGPKDMATKVQWLCWKRHRICVVYFRAWNRQIRHRFDGRAQPCRNQSDVFDSLKPYCAMPTNETTIHRSTKFAQGILISAAPTLQNLRIGLRRRQRGKSIGLAKQRGGWQGKSWSWGRNTKLHSSHLRKSGFSSHHLNSNRRNVFVWYILARRRTWQAEKA